MAFTTKDKFVQDISTGITTAILVALVIGIGGAVMAYLGSAWPKPLLVGGLLFLIGMLIFLAILAIRSFPKYTEITALDNIESRIGSWAFKFQLGVHNQPIPAAYFSIQLMTDSGEYIYW